MMFTTKLIAGKPGTDYDSAINVHVYRNGIPGVSWNMRTGLYERLNNTNNNTTNNNNS